MSTLYVFGYIHLFIMSHMYKVTYAIKSMPPEVQLQKEKNCISNFFAALDFCI